MKLSILGCGNWGSVFGIMQHWNGHTVKIWEFDKERAEYIAQTRDNAPFLINQKIPEEIFVHWNIEKIMVDAEVVVFAVPSQTVSSVVDSLTKINTRDAYYLSLTKGIDINTLKRPSEIINLLASAKNRVYVLSGPSIANEIIRKEPTAVVLVGPDPEGTMMLQHEFASDHFRIYLGDDITGVELGAAIKNVIAVGCGISAGLGFGKNAKGALLARGIVEMQRLGVKLGAKAKTFWGLSGLGDMVTTSFSDESRNHRFGKCIGAGMSMAEIEAEMVMVAEGVPTSKAIMLLSNKYDIEMPICEVVYSILFEKKPPKQGLRDLMTRPLKNE
jgi:glycerol-3-phosphate dehydrogenase (NAD(P)+)